MSKHDQDISSVERWFLSNSLPWSATLELKLIGFGVQCVEHLKEMTGHEWNALFVNEKIITQRVAKRVIAELNAEGEFSPKKCATQLGIVQVTAPLPSKATVVGKGRAKDDGTTKKIADMKWEGFSVLKVKAEENKRRRLERKEEAEQVVNDAMRVEEHSSAEPPSNDCTSVDDNATAEPRDSMDEEDEDTVFPEPGASLLALPPSDWRATRCSLSKDLKDPATAEEMLAWDMDLLPELKKAEHLEDHLKYYLALGCTKVSSDADITAEYKRARKKFSQIALKYHPDKSNKKEDACKYERAHSKYERVVRAYAELGIPDENGQYAMRVSYDQKGEDLRYEMANVSTDYQPCRWKHIISHHIPLLSVILLFIMLQAIDDVYNVTMKQRAKDILERLKRDKIYEKRAKNVQLNASMAILTKISKRWLKSGQQTNRLRGLVCDALKKGYTNTEIALEVRRFTFRGLYFREDKRSQDKKFLAISAQIQTYRKELKEGRMDTVLKLEGTDKRNAMRSKSLNLSARGRKPIDQLGRMEAVLMTWLEERWRLEQRVSRTMIFRQGLVIDPKLCDGIKKDGYLERLKKWFYYGFVRRNNLSIRKIAGAGQKLPNNWEKELINMKGKVRAKQNPVMKPDGTIRIAGVRDANFCNTDHVPIWYETVGNYTWGKKNSGRRSVKTGGKEKNRFTGQLSIGKDGKKLPPFLIFKGEYLVPIIYLYEIMSNTALFPILLLFISRCSCKIR